MKLITEPIDIKELEIMAENFFGNLVKAVVDAELHADQEKW